MEHTGKKINLLTIFTLIFFNLLSCISTEPLAGNENEPCYGNGTCDEGLICISNICVTDGNGPNCEGGNDEQNETHFCKYIWTCDNYNTYMVRCNTWENPDTCTCYLNGNEVGTFEDNGICGEVTDPYRRNLAATKCNWDFGQ